MKANKYFALLLLAQFSLTMVYGQTVNYAPSQSVIANPERGLQKYSITSNDYASVAGENNLAVATLEGWKNSSDNVTVVFRYFLLDSFLTADINSVYLNNIQTDFANIRAAGLKVIVRFSYSNAQSTAPQQPTKAQILTHIGQLSSILNTNEDIILSLQAGFIGTWGEWYYTNSTEFGTEGAISTTQWNNRKEVVDAMLAAAPQSIPLQVRYAEIKQTMYGSIPLTDLTAYQNTPAARIGFFNDAFLNDYGDQGTYSVATQCTNPVGSADHTFIANETKYLPMSGETNGLNACNTGFRTTGANAITEMDLTNWNCINRDYYIPFWDDVISANLYDSVLTRLGYRFQLLSSTITNNNTDFDLSLALENVGFAQLFKQRDVYLVLEETTSNVITSALLNTDIRSWNGTVSLNQNFNLGLSGTFRLYLWMPDSDATLQADPDYSIQCANVGTWDSQTGYNDLLQTITLGSPSSQNILHYTETSGYDHNTRSQSLSMFQDFGLLDGFTVVDDQDGSQFNTLASLMQYDAIVFSNTSGDAILDATQRANFESYIAAGGNVMGIHAASDTYRHSTANGGSTGTWDFYAETIGASVQQNPNHVNGTPSYAMGHTGIHQSTANLPNPWQKNEEYYYWTNGFFDSNNVEVLRVEETVGPNGMVNAYDSARAMSWYRTLPSGSKVFYTALGHSSNNYSNDQLFRQHIRDALVWTMESTASPSLAMKVFLQGPLNGTVMNDDLRLAGLIPSNDPYPSLGFVYDGIGWSDSFDANVLAITGNDAIVDWVIVDMYPDAAVVGNTASRYSRAALLQRDGDIVNLDGSSPLVLNMPTGTYHAAVRHRNHLGAIVSTSSVYGNGTVSIDMTTTTGATVMPEAMNTIANLRALWAGDVNFDEQVKYTGSGNDRDPILVDVGGSIPTNTTAGYIGRDVNLDGIIKYTGSSNDRDIILQVIGGSVPTNVRGQLGF